MIKIYKKPTQNVLFTAHFRWNLKRDPIAVLSVGRARTPTRRRLYNRTRTYPQVYADRSGQRHMRQDRRRGRPDHHADPARPVHGDDHRRFPVLSARRSTDRLLRDREEIAVAVLRVAGARSGHRVRHRFQVRDSNVECDRHFFEKITR